MWLKIKDTKEIRGKIYDTLFNVQNGAFFEINLMKDQQDSDLNLYIFAEFPGINIRAIFYGTEVECINIINKFADKFNAEELNPWD